MDYYKDTGSPESGITSTPPTQPSSSTPSQQAWADSLRSKYGIAEPMADPEGDEE